MYLSLQIKAHQVEYKGLSRDIRELAKKIKELDPKDRYRAEATSRLLEKLYCLGLISTKLSLELANKVSATSFCRRRLPVMMVRCHMAENLKTATKFVEQGHIRVGPEVIKDPAFLLTRNMEDFLTWTDTSKIRKQVLEYNNLVSQFLLHLTLIDYDVCVFLSPCLDIR
ncbi:U3 small nucleolar ribonucleoprotein protein IMP3-like [Octopus bimaculoides]|uniref:U3 small nucleolar ribonucleoprotein protein IMP3-like n=1 Tax=Octopus bimaculoides TaxID=37653 RepID=UPI00071CB518|nr:U3 small nucleolar ribonucleoprotein protein IMP3-like [Octopus bimaculoides]|eukprot:XP_014776281.1 PREDICTED: U3 small nucleolar ribonucleoprotein protein IMP3-like [Octopus bimaculoides]